MERTEIVATEFGDRALVTEFSDATHANCIVVTVARSYQKYSSQAARGASLCPTARPPPLQIRLHH